MKKSIGSIVSVIFIAGMALPLGAQEKALTPIIAEPVPPEERMQVQPILDVPLRDPSICRGPDGTYYLTGTLSFKDEGKDFQNNAGIRLWKSTDLKNWEDLGLVWDPRFPPNASRAHAWVVRPLGDADTIDSLRHNAGIIAPEIHYLKDTFWLTFSRGNMGTGLLRSISGKPEGPYEAVDNSSRITHWGRDASLFQDDDGSVYWLWAGPQVFIARMKDDLSGLAEAPRVLMCEQPLPTLSIDGEVPQSGIVGRYGPFLFKANGAYHLTAADILPKDTANISATFVARSQDGVYGPYAAKKIFVDHSGQSTVFRDNAGDWHATFCGLGSSAAFRDRVGIVPLEWLAGYRVSYYPNKINLDYFNEGPWMTVNRFKVFTERGPWAKLRPIIPETMEIVDGIKQLNLWDTGLTCAPDGYFYATGSQRGPDFNKKLRVWRSKDLRHWEPHIIRTFADEERMPQKRKDTVVDNLGDVYMDCKISWLSKQETFAVYYNVYPVHNKKLGLSKEEMSNFEGILVSESGTIEGPWRWHDAGILQSAHFYELEDGRTVVGGGVLSIRILKPGYWDVRTEGEQRIGPEWTEYGKSFHNPPDTFAHFVEDSGTHLHRIGDQWVQMPVSANYDCMIGFPTDFKGYAIAWSTSDSIEGPWSKWQPGIPHGGHGGITQGPDGNWYALAWYWRSTLPLYCHSPAVLRLNVEIEDGKLQSMSVDPDWTAEDYVVPDWVK